MKKLPKRLELFANIAIVIVAVLLVAVIAKRFIFTTNSRVQQNPPQVGVGAKLSMPGMDWSKSDRTLLVVLAKDCKYCTESASFYKRLVEEQARRKSFRLVAVLPQSVDEAQRYLNDLNVHIDEIKQMSPRSLGVTGTPALLLVNNSGIVTDAWVGTLSQEKESEVLSKL